MIVKIGGFTRNQEDGNERFKIESIGREEVIT